MDTDIAAPGNPVNDPALLAAAAPTPEDQWFELIRPDFVQGNASVLAGAAKLIEAKKALKGTKGSFVRLVERLGQDLDTVERKMKIARHPVLRDSAHARNLPLSWMTLYTLAALPPKALEDFIGDGTVHPGLERKQAERLVQKVRGSNSNGAGGQDRDDGGDHHDAGDAGDQQHHADAGGDHHDGGDAGDCHHHHHGAGGGDHAEDHDARDSEPPAQDIGPNSRGELDRKAARLEELERENRRLERTCIAQTSEIEELQARLGPEEPIRSQRKLFQRAARALKKAEVPDTLEKEARSLKQGAVTDLVELVRSAVRDGLEPNRFDLFYRPAVH